MLLEVDPTIIKTIRQIKPYYTDFLVEDFNNCNYKIDQTLINSLLVKF